MTLHVHVYETSHLHINCSNDKQFYGTLSLIFVDFISGTSKIGWILKILHDLLQLQPSLHKKSFSHRYNRYRYSRIHVHISCMYAILMLSTSIVPQFSSISHWFHTQIVHKLCRLNSTTPHISTLVHLLHLASSHSFNKILNFSWLILANNTTTPKHLDRTNNTDSCNVQIHSHTFKIYLNTVTCNDFFTFWKFTPVL